MLLKHKGLIIIASILLLLLIVFTVKGIHNHTKKVRALENYVFTEMSNNMNSAIDYLRIMENEIASWKRSGYVSINAMEEGERRISHSVYHLNHLPSAYQQIYPDSILKEYDQHIDRSLNLVWRTLRELKFQVQKTANENNTETNEQIILNEEQLDSLQESLMVLTALNTIIQQHFPGSPFHPMEHFASPSEFMKDERWQEMILAMDRIVYDEYSFRSLQPFFPVGANAFFNAIELGNVEVVKKLLKLGADPNTVLVPRGYPLYIAIRHDQPEMVKLLLEAGAIPGQTLFGESLIDYSRKRGQDEIVELLKGHK